MTKQQVTVIIISHNNKVIDFADKIYELNQCKLNTIK